MRALHVAGPEEVTIEVLSPAFNVLVSLDSDCGITEIVPVYEHDPCPTVDEFLVLLSPRDRWRIQDGVAEAREYPDCAPRVRIGMEE